MVERGQAADPRRPARFTCPAPPQHRAGATRCPDRRLHYAITPQSPWGPARHRCVTCRNLNQVAANAGPRPLAKPSRRRRPMKLMRSLPDRPAIADRRDEQPGRRRPPERGPSFDPARLDLDRYRSNAGLPASGSRVATRGRSSPSAPIGGPVVPLFGQAPVTSVTPGG
jgi:hypothetical protein